MSNECKFYYHETPRGSRIFMEECGSGPLMVLMHGLGGTTNTFQPLVSHFSSQYTMLRFDFPGSGFSTFKLPPSISQFVEDLTSILASRPAREYPILVGHSLGSIVAMHYASSHSDVRALILIGAGRSAANIPAAVERMSGLAATVRSGGIECIRDSTVANNVAISSSDLVRTIVRQMISSQSSEGYAATCEAIVANTHLDPDYHAIKCPVLLITGDQDMISPISRSEDLKHLIGSSREGKVALEVVRSAHQQILEDTAGVVGAMQKLLNGLLSVS